MIPSVHPSVHLSLTSVVLYSIYHFVHLTCPWITAIICPHCYLSIFPSSSPLSLSTLSLISLHPSIHLSHSPIYPSTHLSDPSVYPSNPPTHPFFSPPITHIHSSTICIPTFHLSPSIHRSTFYSPTHPPTFIHLSTCCPSQKYSSSS